MLNWIPTRTNLVAHGLKIGSLCPICSRKDETTSHILWRCSSLKSIRSLSGFSSFGSFMDSISFFEHVLTVKNEVTTKEFELLCILWWRVWFRRNHMFHSSVMIPDQGIFDWAVSFMNEFRNAKQLVCLPPPKQVVSRVWKAPQAGCYKINTNVALNNHYRVFGVGVMIWDCNGLVMASLCLNLRVCYQP
ncbi:hypothetical protein LWI28_001000 [Acer negundo]|uniref:Reverse transcriptase zinc-binding domain-containing protein n=1 Tax=Acer negundo TaxID=4023 RepID=A0AAD5JNV3_ACENE|nr:hypothetical protein LWI28_001000 [Acer negundo]